MRHPLVEGESTSPTSGSRSREIRATASAVLDYERFLFLNSDLTINLLRRPVGAWICLDASSALSPNGGGIAESALYDVQGFMGRAAQSLAVRMR